MYIFKNIRKKKKGITLIEALVAVLVLGFTLSVLLGVFVMSRVSATMARHRMEAMNHARAAMELLKDDLSATFILPSGDINDLNGVYIADTGSGNIRTVTVTIQWDERLRGGTSRTMTENLVTLIND